MIKVNNREIEVIKFPNNESLIKTEVLNEELEKEVINVNFKFITNEDILNLLFVLGHIDNYRQEEGNKWKKIILNIYYMPYSRMDRSENGSCFTLLHISELLSRYLINTDIVNIVEPHSDKTIGLLLNNIHNYCIMNQNVHRVNVITPLMNHILSKEKIDVICYPDKGAKQRFESELSLPVVYCEKKRDFETGQILGLDLISDIDITDKNVLILDDLSSYGGTFYYTSLKLKENGANKVYLGICHCEESIKQGKIYDDGSNPMTPIEHIYCMNTMLSEDSQVIKLGKNITVYDIEQFLENGEFKNV